MKRNPLINFHTNRRTIELIATYEELYRVPEDGRVTCYYERIGSYLAKDNTADSMIHAAYRKALHALGVSSRTFQQSDEFIYRSDMLARMRNGMLEPGTQLREVLGQWPEGGIICVVHEGGGAPEIPVEDLGSLTAAGREDFAALLDAQVKEIRSGDSAIEIVISGVEPQELERFCEAFQNHQEAEQAMWSM